MKMSATPDHSTDALVPFTFRTLTSVALLVPIHCWERPENKMGEST